MTHILNYEFDEDRIVQCLDSEGMVFLKNLISKEFIEMLKIEGHNLYRNSSKVLRTVRACNSEDSFRFNITPAKARTLGGDSELESINSIIEHPKMRKSVYTALRSKSGVSNNIYDYSKGKSEKEMSGKELFPLHYDWRDYSR